MDYLDNMEEEYHKSYPDDPCPMEGGYKASFQRFEIESIGAEWGMLNFPTRISLISRIFRNLLFFRSQATYSCNSCNSCSVNPISNSHASWFLNTNLSNLTNLRLLGSFSIETKWESPLLATKKNPWDLWEPFNDKVNLGANRGGRKVKMQHKGSLSYDLGK